MEHVIISHGSLRPHGWPPLFSDATFYLQERELSQWIWTLSLSRPFRWLMTAADPADIEHAAELAQKGQLVSVQGDAENILPGIDLRLAAGHPYAGSQFVVVRNDGQSSGKAKTLTCALGTSCTGTRTFMAARRMILMYVPVGLAVGSQTNLIMASDAIMKAVGHDWKRVLAAHEENLPNLYPTRKTKLWTEHHGGRARRRRGQSCQQLSCIRAEWSHPECARSNTKASPRPLTLQIHPASPNLPAQQMDHANETIQFPDLSQHSV